MPYISDAGAGSWSDVINGIGNNIRGSLAGVRQHNEQQAEQERPLRPELSQWIDKIRSGEMTAAQAAVAAHNAMGGQSGPSAPPIVGQGPMPAPGRLSLPGEQGDTSQVYGGIQEAAAAPMPEVAPQKPTAPSYNQRDLGQAKVISDMQKDVMQRHASATDQMALERLRQEGRGSLETQRQGGKEALVDKKFSTFGSLTEKRINNERLTDQEKIAWNYFNTLMRHNDKMDELSVIMQKAREGKATDREIATAKLMVSSLNSEVGGAAKELTSLNALAGNSDTIADAKKLQAQSAAKLKVLNEFFNGNMNKPSAAPQKSSPPPGAGLPERRGGDTGVIQMLFPDGKTYPVTADKVEIAIRKGGKQVGK